MPDGHPSRGDAPPTNDGDRGVPFSQPPQGTQPAPATSTVSHSYFSLSALVATLGRNTLIALAGALITLLSFFTLPYVTASVQVVNSILSPVLDPICGTNGCTFAF